MHGKQSYRSCGAEKLFSTVFHKLHIYSYDFTDFTANPKWTDTQKGLTVCKKQKPSLIIGVGGGSVLDMAKLIRFFYSYTGTPTSFSREKKLVPLLLFPTTAGTGTENTHFAVCYIDDIKYSVTHKAMLPNDYYIDPIFTYSSSPYLTACTGFDALAHAIESYWSINSTEKSRKYAKEAIRYIYPNLLKCIYQPTKHVRKKLVYGAHLAGKAINTTFTTAAHAYSYGITTRLGIPHGHAVAHTFAYFFELNANISEVNCSDARGAAFVQERIKELCALLHFDQADCFFKLSNYIDEVFKCSRTCKKITEDEIDKIFSLVNLERLKNNPVIVREHPLKEKCIMLYK